MTCKESYRYLKHIDTGNKNMDLQKHSSVYSGSIQSKQCEPDKKFAVESFQAVAGNCVLKCEDIKHVLSPASVKLV